MVLCATGSQPKASSPPYSWITWVEANSWLGAAFAKFSWLAYLLAPVLVKVDDFCGVEPVQPLYPGDAVVAAASTDPAAFEAVIQFLKDSATWYAWSQLCQCNASGTPGCTTPIWSLASTPTTLGPVTNSEYNFRGSVAGSGYTLYGAQFYSPVVQDIEIFVVTMPTGPADFPHFSCSVGWNALYFPTPFPLVSGQDYRIGFRGTTSGASFEGGFTSGHTHSATSPVTLAGYESGTWNFSPTAFSLNDVAVDPIICQHSPVGYAPAAPPVPTTTLPDVPAGPCTTVGDLCGILQPTIQDIALLKQRLDLLQRRLLPFAWIPGTVTSGLSGSGVISVTDCLGCIVVLTTVPGGWGSSVETPRRLIPSAGSIQGVNGGNYDDNRQVHYEHEIFVTSTPWATGLRYNFRPGVVASITPIFPEP